MGKSPEYWLEMLRGNELFALTPKEGIEDVESPNDVIDCWLRSNDMLG